ncbi:MAG: GspE/PulE family protein [Thermodesulfobacteriota bacterium]|nr:GspE/PulE family protein [Thermodesulfobacteriota bacterium]
MDERHLIEQLVAGGQLSEANRTTLFQLQEKSGRRLLQLATEVGMFSEEEVVDHVGRICKLDRVSLNDVTFAEEQWEGLTDFFITNHVVPLAREDGKIHVVLFDPSDTMLTRSLELGTGADIKISLAPQKDIIRFWGKYLEVDTEEEEDIDRMIDIASEAPVVRVVSDILSRAVELSASDIHLEARGNDLVLRYRMDGMLHTFPPPPSGMSAAIISRIKILANLDIAERRLPQDGSIKLATSAKEVDVRVSIIPTVHGEGVVLRILDKENINLDLPSLGFSPEKQEQILAMLRKSYGMLIVSGPTGAGKTTTLYAALQTVLSESRKVVTIEDPVEFKMEAATQIQVNPKAGLTFAKGLRSILRHDPDVMLVGEIRDSETAAISVQSALTGHLVLSTLHANRASQVFSRLLDMGVEPFLASASVVGSISQRLVRRLCLNCREKCSPRVVVQKQFKIGADTVLYKNRGCELCNQTGFNGRLGIFEIISVNDEIQRHILTGASAGSIEKSARADGFKPMAEDGLEKALAGKTTIEEIMRVVG